MRKLLLALFLMGGCAPQLGSSFRQLAYPMETRTLDVDGIELAYSDRGHGPRTLLLIHGLGSYLPVWSRNVEALAREYRVVAIDLPGYGKSSKANYHYSMAFFARVVERVIARLALEHVVLIGHSMGGQIAITHSLMFPGRAEALVLVAPAGLEPFGPGEGGWLADVVSKELVMLTPPDAIWSNVESNFYQMPKAARFMAEDRVRIVGGPDFDDYAYAVSRSVTAMVTGPVFRRLGEVRAPVLITFGREDGLIPNPLLHGRSTEEVARAGAARFRDARLTLIPHAGHMVQFEKPDAWNACVLEFLHTLHEENAP